MRWLRNALSLTPTPLPEGEGRPASAHETARHTVRHYRLHRAPRRIDFEFGTPRARGAMLPWLLLAGASVIAADVGRSYIELRAAYVSVSARIAALPPHEPRPATPAYVPKDLDRELALARATVHRMALPWNTLFRALGAAESEGVALLTIEPDAGGGTVQVTAEARDVPAMLTYLARLEAQPHFPSAVLTRHEVRKADARQPVYFVVSLTWKPR